MLFQISLKSVPNDPVDNDSALVRVMICSQAFEKPFTWWSIFLTLYGFIMPQTVKLYPALLNSLPLKKWPSFWQTTFSNGFAGIKMVEFRVKFVPRCPIDNAPALVKVIAWRRLGDRSLSEPMLTQSTDAYMRHANRKIIDLPKMISNPSVESATRFLPGNQQQGKSDGFLIAAIGLVILLKLDSNRRFFKTVWPWNLMDDPKNNRAPLLCYFKIFASFGRHWWIQTGVTVRKHLIWVKIDDFFIRVTLKFDGWTSKIIGHLFYATSSFVHHFVAIDEFKLELQSGNA